MLPFAIVHAATVNFRTYRQNNTDLNKDTQSGVILDPPLGNPFAMSLQYVMMSRAIELSKLILLTGITGRLFTLFSDEVNSVIVEYNRSRRKFL